jgi:hypothetical protein
MKYLPLSQAALELATHLPQPPDAGITGLLPLCPTFYILRCISETYVQHSMCTTWKGHAFRVSHLSCCLVRPDVLPSAVSSAPFSASVRKLCSECKDVVADTFRKPDSHAARTPEGGLEWVVCPAENWLTVMLLTCGFVHEESPAAPLGKSNFVSPFPSIGFMTLLS